MGVRITMKKLVVCLRERGGAGDVLTTFPAAKQLKEDGYTVLYFIEHRFTDWAKLCPYIDEVIPIPAGIMCWSASPFRDEQYLVQLMKLTMGRYIVDDVDRVVNFFDPCVYVERVFATFGIPCPLCRAEMFWLAAGYRLEDMPPDPMYGTISLDYPKMYEKPYYVVQAHSDAPERRLMPPLAVGQKVRSDALREGVERVFVVGQYENYTNPLISAIPGAEMALNLTPERILGLCVGAERIYTPDSLFIHVAACVGVPSTSWFSCTDGHSMTHCYPLAEFIQGDCDPVCWHLSGSTVRRHVCLETGICHAFPNQ